MKRVLILANYDEGLYKFRKEVIEELVKDYEVFVSVPAGEYTEKIRDLGAEVILTEFNRRGTNPVKDIGLVLKYKSILNEVKPDAVLTYTIKPNIYGGIACGKKYPQIANITGLGSAVENESRIQNLVINLYRFGLRNTYRVFFQNSANRDFMIEHNMVKNNYDMLPGSGVNLEHFKYTPMLKKDTIDFVYVGRIMKEKGIDEYLYAAEKIREERKDVLFHVCGFYEDDYKDRIEELVKKEIIVYHGTVKDMAEFYPQIDCTVLPTYYPEGLSNVLLESCASGRPIITTDRPGCREVVKDGINGYIVKQQDGDDLVRIIKNFMSLEYFTRNEIGWNARLKVEDKFDRKIVIKKYKEAIKNATGKAR